MAKATEKKEEVAVQLANNENMSVQDRQFFGGVQKLISSQDLINLTSTYKEFVEGVLGAYKVTGIGEMENTLDPNKKGEMMDTIEFTDLETGEAHVFAGSVFVSTCKKALNISNPAYIFAMSKGKVKGKSGYSYDMFDIKMIPADKVKEINDFISGKAAE